MQVHRYAVDPWIDPSDAAALGASVTASGAAFEDHITPGEGHHFTDLAGPDGDEEAGATPKTVELINEFLDGPIQGSSRTEPLR